MYACRYRPMSLHIDGSAAGEAIDIVTTRPYDMGDQAVGLLAKESWDRHLAPTLDSWDIQMLYIIDMDILYI